MRIVYRVAAKFITNSGPIDPARIVKQNNTHFLTLHVLDVHVKYHYKHNFQDDYLKKYSHNRLLSEYVHAIYKGQCCLMRDRKAVRCRLWWM